MKYNSTQQTSFTFEECSALVGSKARLPLTGRIVEAGESQSGPYVKFELSPRWGFPPGTRFTVDVEALDKVDSRRAKGRT